MLAKLVSREPLDLPPVEVVADDVVRWVIPYVPGAESPPQDQIPAGEYVLNGRASGYANVSLVARGNDTTFSVVKLAYHDYSNDGALTLNGWENVTVDSLTPTRERVAWYSNMTQTGQDGYLATKKSGDDGFHVELDVLLNFLDINGTLVTSINGEDYYPPQSGT